MRKGVAARPSIYCYVVRLPSGKVWGFCHSGLICFAFTNLSWARVTVTIHTGFSETETQKLPPPRRHFPPSAVKQSSGISD